MARPDTRDTLLAASETGLRLLLEEVDSIPAGARDGEFAVRDGDRCVRDVLSHLHEWHELMLGWYGDGMAGRKPDIPAAGHTWKTTPALNAELRAKHQGTSLDDAREKLLTSHRTLQNLICAHSDEELFTKQRYPWTGTTSLGAYLVSCTSSHYDWARKKIRRYRKSLGSQQ